MNLKRVIGQMTDEKELRDLERYVGERRRELAKRRYEELCVEAWERTKGLAVGTELHVCASGTFFGGPFQRGDHFKVTAIQPRAKRIWVEHDGNQFGYWFGPEGIHRYDLRTIAPEKPMDTEEKERVQEMSKRLAEVGI